MNQVIIKGINMPNDEIAEFTGDQTVEFLIDRQQKFGLSNDTVALIFMFIQGIGINAAYDIMKYSLLKVFGYFKQRKSKPTYISVTANGKTESIYLNFALDEEQTNKLLDAAITKFLES